ncbi:MAG: Ppx/GppA phosphatase family protein [Myxococcota bacterium]|nr:Ppx/GppA phosphatase family protein [Myxococcota bacterium]
MVVARIGDDGAIHVVDRLKRTVRLAAGLDANGDLDAEARERALEALTQMGERIATMPARAVRVVGTNTLRRARNSAALLAESEVALGHPIAIISGHEEARLIYQGVHHDRPPEGRRLVVDIGGGSTELIIGEDAEPGLLDSRFMGCVSWSMRFFPDGRITKKRFGKAITAARVGLDSIARNYIALGWDESVGSSGTINAVEKVLMESGLGPDGITPDALDRLRREFIRLGHSDALDLPGLSERRRPVIAGGLAVLIGVFDALGIRRMEATESALREGVLHDLLGRLAHSDVRERTIARLAEQHAVDRTHAAHVEACAVSLFEQVHRGWNLHPTRDLARIRWAARIHEMGISISYDSYHKHGAYLLRHGDLPGFSRQGQSILAALVLAHRGKLDRDRITAVYTGPLEPVLHLAVVLRLARRLHRARAPGVVPVPTLTATPRRLRLAFPDGFLDERPLMRADLKEEVGVWGQAGMVLEVV